MSDPTTTNAVASVVNDVLRSLIEGAGEKAVEAAVIANQPWLGLPFVRQIFEFILGFLGKFFYKQAALAATSVIIDVQIGLEKSTTYSAFQNLQLAVASGDKNAITKASADLDSAYASLIHYDGSASP